MIIVYSFDTDLQNNDRSGNTVNVKETMINLFDTRNYSVEIYGSVIVTTHKTMGFP